jgi:hypothetical protein
MDLDQHRPVDGPALSGIATGSGLAALLESLDPRTATDAALVERVAAARRLESWAHALAARDAAELAGRPAMNPSWDPAAGHPPAQACVAGDELAMRLSCSRREATRLVDHGRAFTRDLVATGEALAAGDISAVAAGLIADRLSDQPSEIATAVEARVLPEAPFRTPTQLTRDLERALIEIDPAEAAHRIERAQAGRRVYRPRPLPDGLASLTAILPAATAARIDATLDTAARAARSAGDPRTLDQLRADGLRDLVLPSDQPADGDPAPSTGHARGHHRTEVRITMPLTTVLGLDDQPADLSGIGPIDAHSAREAALAAGAVWRRIVTDPVTGAVLDVGRTTYRPPRALVRHIHARDTQCARPGCSTPAEVCDIDHTIEYHAPPDGTPPGTTAHDNLGALCHRDHRLKTDGGFTLRQTSPGVYVWTTPTGERHLVQPGADGRHRPLGAAGDGGGEPRPTAAPGETAAAPAATAEAPPF